MAAATDTQFADLLDPAFVARLERLEIVSKKIFQGKVRGERRSKRRGESVEFADHRNYVVGDDLRFLDWNIYARLDRLFLKVFLEEEDLHVNVLFDSSASMDWGKPSKTRYARQVAAALGYIGLANNDRVSLYAFADGLKYELAGMRSKRMAAKTFEFLTNVECGGASDLTRACKQFAMRHAQPGILLVVSDFLDKGGYETGLRMLLGRRFDIYCIQVLAPDLLWEVKVAGDGVVLELEESDETED